MKKLLYQLYQGTWKPLWKEIRKRFTGKQDDDNDPFDHPFAIL